MEKKKAGRPKTGQVKNWVVSVAVIEREHDFVRDQSLAAGIKNNKYLRSLIQKEMRNLAKREARRVKNETV